MYGMEEMIDLGLMDKQKFPTKAHRVVAVNLAICNPSVSSRDHITEIVQAVISVPRSEIKTVTLKYFRDRGVNI